MDTFKTSVLKLVNKRVQAINQNGSTRLSFMWDGITEIELSPDSTEGSYHNRREELVTAITDLVIEAIDFHSCEEHIIKKIHSQ